MAERQKLETGMKTVIELEQEAADGLELLELADGDEEMLGDVASSLRRAAEKAEKAELEALLSGEADGNDCYLNINSGAGGTESQDWASMIRRMYVRWAEQSGYKVEEVESHDGDEAGIKSATLLIKGENAYGWLKSEQGVHRLVRISPFDSSARRHTSFASVGARACARSRAARSLSRSRRLRFPRAFDPTTRMKSRAPRSSASASS